MTVWPCCAAAAAAGPLPGASGAVYGVTTAGVELDWSAAPLAGGMPPGAAAPFAAPLLCAAAPESGAGALGVGPSSGDEEAVGAELDLSADGAAAGAGDDAWPAAGAGAWASEPEPDAPSVGATGVGGGNGAGNVGISPVDADGAVDAEGVDVGATDPPVVSHGAGMTGAGAIVVGELRNPSSPARETRPAWYVRSLGTAGLATARASSIALGRDASW
jgi:hypothetical protein